MTLTYAERVERDRNELRRRLDDVGISVAEFAILKHIHYGCRRPRHLLAQFAASPDYALGASITAKEASLAVRSCFKRGYLRVLSQGDLENLKRELIAEGYLGPIYDFLPAGCVDFTDRGTEVWLTIEKFQRDQFPVWPPRGFAYHDTVEAKTRWTFVSRASMNRRRHQLRKEIDFLEMTAPTQIDQVRLAPWSPPMPGWSFDATEHCQFQGWGGGSESFLNWESEIGKFDLSAVRRECRRSRITPCELSVLLSIARWGANGVGATAGLALAFAKRNLNLRATREVIVTAVQSCLQKNLLVGLTSDEVQLMYLAKNARTPNLVSRDRWRASIDLSEAGATFLNENCPMIFGKAWLDGWSVSRQIFRREHRYARNLRDLASVFEEYAEKTQERVQINSIKEIGPWCVYWWKRFPKGYRIELEITPEESQS